MKLALAALCASSLAHADVKTTAAADASFTTIKSSWEVAVQTGDLAKKAPVLALVKVPRGGMISGVLQGSETFGTVVRGNLEIADHALAAGDTWSALADEGQRLDCASESTGDCLVVIYLPGGLDLQRGMMIKSKKLKVKDIVQPVKIQKQ